MLNFININTNVDWNVIVDVRSSERWRCNMLKDRCTRLSETE